MQRINKREYLARLRQGKRVFRTRHGFWSMPTHQEWERLVKNGYILKNSSHLRID